MTTLSRVADRPTWLLSRANARAKSMLTAAFAAHGVRGYHFRLLAALDEHGPASQAELGRLSGIDRSDVVATLNEMAELKLLRREPDPVDRRRNVVSITRHGTAMLEALDLVLTDVQHAVLEPLTERERQTLVRLLVKLA